MEKRINRLLKDYSEQVDLEKFSILITSSKQLQEPDPRWYLEYLDTNYSSASKDIDRFKSFFEVSDDVVIELNRLRRDAVVAFARPHQPASYAISISEGVCKQAYLTALDFLSNKVFGQVLAKEVYPQHTENIAYRFILDLMTISFQFTLFHELFHIALGHFHCVGDEDTAKTLYEKQPNPTSTPLVHQAIEVQSDLASEIFISQSGRFSNFLLGIGLTVFLDTFNYAARDIDEYQEETHPHPLTRLMYCTSRLYGGETERYAEQFKQGSSFALESFKHYSDGLLFNSSTQSKFSIEQQFHIAENDADEIGYKENRLWLEVVPLSPAIETLCRRLWGWTFDKVAKHGVTL